tara:strand:- start:3048 stop:3842 length:795 start_codon:yes stop_codon:yes gene_type:complete
VESVSDRFKKDDNYNILECKCGMVMLNPRHSINDIEKHYKNQNYQPHYKKNNFINFLYRIAQIINNKSKISLIEKYFKKSSLLDFGGGDGQFSSYMINKKWNSHYYEPHLDKKNKNHICNLSDLNQLKFDVVTMFHSIEHLHNIDESLEIIYNSLHKDGVLVLSFPNYCAYEKTFFKKNWVAYDAPRHLYHFSQKTIKKVLIKNNFEIIESRPLYLDTFYNIIMSTDKLYKFLFLVPLQIILSLFKILKDNTLGSSLLLVCKKL